MKFTYNDGGRAAAGYQGSAGDCFVRATAIASGIPYQHIYDLVNRLAYGERRGKRKRGISSARNGVYSATARRVLESLGFRWVPTMKIGSGCKVHLHDGELPMGRLVVVVSKHYTTVIDGEIHDTHDPQREVHVIDRDVGQPLKAGQARNQNGICSVQRRCVYGYFVFEGKAGAAP